MNKVLIVIGLLSFSLLTLLMALTGYRVHQQLYSDIMGFTILQYCIAITAITTLIIYSGLKFHPPVAIRQIHRIDAATAA